VAFTANNARASRNSSGGKRRGYLQIDVGREWHCLRESGP